MDFGLLSLIAPFSSPPPSRARFWFTVLSPPAPAPPATPSFNGSRRSARREFNVKATLRPCFPAPDTHTSLPSPHQSFPFSFLRPVNAFLLTTPFRSQKDRTCTTVQRSQTPAQVLCYLNAPSNPLDWNATPQLILNDHIARSRGVCFCHFSTSITGRLASCSKPSSRSTFTARPEQLQQRQYECLRISTTATDK